MNYADFNRIYDEYSVLVWSIAMKYTQDRYLSEDICQEVFEKLHKKAPHIAPDKMKAWLMVVTKNQALDYMKKMRQTELTSLDEAERVSGGIGDDPLRRIVSREHSSEILQALRDYNPEWYELMLQVVAEDVDMKELAARLNITVNNLYTRIHRIRKWLRENFPDL